VRRGGEGSGQGGAGRKRGGWWAARGFRTWAERPNAGPHVGEKTNKKHELSVSEKKTKDLRFRVFSLSYLGLGRANVDPAPSRAPPPSSRAARTGRGGVLIRHGNIPAQNPANRIGVGGVTEIEALASRLARPWLGPGMRQQSALGGGGGEGRGGGDPDAFETPRPKKHEPVFAALARARGEEQPSTRSKLLTASVDETRNVAGR
jgi:hypothetical protein